LKASKYLFVALLFCLSASLSTLASVEPVYATDFTITVNPSFLQVPQGSTATAILAVTTPPAQPPTSMSANLTSSGLPAGLSMSFSPNPMPLVSGTTTTGILTIVVDQNAQVGNYTMTIIVEFSQASAGSIVHTVQIKLKVTSSLCSFVNESDGAGFAPCFHVLPASMTIRRGAQANYTIQSYLPSGTFAWLDVAARITLLPPVPNSPGFPTNLTFRLSPQFIVGNSTSVVTILTSRNSTVGGYLIIIYLHFDSVVQSTSVHLSVVPSLDDYWIRASPDSLVIPQGSSATTIISGSVVPVADVILPIRILGWSITPSGKVGAEPSISAPLFLQPTLQESPKSGWVARANLTITVGSNVTVGNYTIIIIASWPETDGVTKQAAISLTVVQPRCLIATATYDSELAGPVQFLRNFRDHDVDSTRLGHAFLTAFNPWYYSWAPPVAQTIANSNENVKSSMRVLIAPLIASLFVAHGVFQNTVALNPEVAILLAGFVASALIGAMYLTLPLTVLMYRNRRRGTKYLFPIVAMVGLILALFGTIMHGSADLMEVSTGIMVVQTILLTPTALARTILNHHAH
jgi:hypothetical protein